MPLEEINIRTDIATCIVVWSHHVCVSGSVTSQVLVIDGAISRKLLSEPDDVWGRWAILRYKYISASIDGTPERRSNQGLYTQQDHLFYSSSWFRGTYLS